MEGVYDQKNTRMLHSGHDREIRTSIKELLEEDGYAIIEAVDGEDGIKKFRDHRGSIDLLLLDVIMPKKTRKEVFESIAIPTRRSS